ncbi:hypothetical protein ALC57_15625 [Trachymyrmex cornetzi]|uniref:Uncharacterized protein n=1 Tax=Trachymyrmex cornetzi TaxID=471704 RepID=A0A151IWN0_9HYME|nr:hypothetical protein ALC57_15625 [Trachymyrmex cornetzi]
MKWQSTPQLSWQREFRRRQLLKAFGIYKMLRRIENLKIQRQFWVRPIFTEERRHLQGASDNLIREMQYIDMEKHIEYLRMDTLTFRIILNIMNCYI